MPPRATDDSPDRSHVGADEFFLLYHRHSRHMLAWLSGRVPSGELDAVHQEIWAAAWERRGNLPPGAGFRAWLFAAARDHLLGSPRPGRTDAAESAPNADAGSGRGCDMLVDAGRQVRLTRCLAALPDVRRRVVEARLAGEDFRTIAAALGTTGAQAQSHFFAAAKQLQSCLEGR